MCTHTHLAILTLSEAEGEGPASCSLHPPKFVIPLSVVEWAGGALFAPQRRDLQ
jgi:hypothetical protein